MTPAQIRTRMETASTRLRQLLSDLATKDTLLRAGRDVNGDGTFDERDSATVERVRARTQDAQIRIDGLLQQLLIAEAEADGAPIEIIDFEEGSFIEGNADRKPFEHDRNLFKTKISLWGGDPRIP
ncbi:MAG: hypothetical protein L3J33_11375 [Rhodobacteraceae bacterium]|nr:hypothetical protein [Paracoccaceae bacterium]